MVPDVDTCGAQHVLYTKQPRGAATNTTGGVNLGLTTRKNARKRVDLPSTMVVSIDLLSSMVVSIGLPLIMAVSW